MKKVLVLSVFLMSVAVIAQAQFQQFHAGATFPTGKFADGDDEKDESPQEDGKGFAGMGFTLGYKLYNPLSMDNLTWVFGIEAFFNPVSKDSREYDEEHSGYEDLTHPIYLNFPVTFGLNYAIPLNGEKMKLYGEAAAGANFSYITNSALKNSKTGKPDVKGTITPMFGFTYGLEVGLFIDNKYSIGLRHNNLGSYKYKYEMDFSGNTASIKTKFEKALPITVTSVCLGLLF